MNFDDMSQLYKDDPDEFERKCKELIADTIASFPEERREKAQQFQWRIDQQLHHIKDPIARMNKMVELFWEGVNRFQLALTDPSQLKPANPDGKTSTVIPFNKS